MRFFLVPRKVLKERYEDAPEEDEIPLHEGHMTSDSDDYDSGKYEYICRHRINYSIRVDINIFCGSAITMITAETM